MVSSELRCRQTVGALPDIDQLRGLQAVLAVHDHLPQNRYLVVRLQMGQQLDPACSLRSGCRRRL